MELVGFFTLIAVKEPEKPDKPEKPEKPESYTLKLDGTVHLDGYNAQQGQALFYVEHKVGSDTGRVPAYYVVRFLTASYEAGVLMPGTEVPPGALADTDGTILVDTDGAYVTDGPQSRAGSDEDPLETLSFTYPPDSYGYANTLKVEAYSDPQRSRLIADGSFPITRDNPVYKARDEVWNNGLVFRNGEFILLDDKVYMWDYPVAGNSKIRPDLDRKQNPQFEDNIPYKLDDRTHWTPYDEWEVLATKVLFSQFALLGGAVMAGKMNAQGKYDYAKMYSQTGQDGTMSYERFDASKDAWDNTQKWKPNLCLDFLKGTAFSKDFRAYGSIRNPFTKVEDVKDKDYNDCIYFKGKNAWFNEFSLPFDDGQSGRRVTLVNYDGSSQINGGYAIIKAENGKSFFEGGVRKKALYMPYGQTVNLLGFAMDGTFTGWIVVNRNYVFGDAGEAPKLLGFGTVQVNKLISGGIDVSIDARACNGKNFSVFRLGVGEYQVNFPFAANIYGYNLFITVFGEGSIVDVDSSEAHPAKATLAGITSQWFTVYVSDDATLNDGSFSFMVYNKDKMFANIYQEI